MSLASSSVSSTVRTGLPFVFGVATEVYIMKSFISRSDPRIIMYQYHEVTSFALKNNSTTYGGMTTTASTHAFRVYGKNPYPAHHP